VRVLFDHTIFLNQRFGGISRYFFELMESSSKLGLDFKVFSPFYRNEYLDEKNPKNYLKKKVNTNNRYLNYLLDIGLDFGESFYSLQNKPDLIHRTFYTGRRSFYFNKAPHVLTIYDLIHELFEYYEPPYRKGWKNKERSIYAADFFLCISENTKKDLLDIYDLDPDRVFVTKLGVNHNTFNPFTSNPDKFDSTGIPSKFILFVGWRKWYKNFLNLLKAFSLIHSTHQEINLVCYGGGDFDVDELRLIKSFGLSHKIFHISGDDSLLSDLYSRAELFVYPSMYEGFGLPPLEAMACGCPVVSSSAGSLNEILKDAPIYIENVNEPDSIAKSLEAVLSSDELKRNLISNGISLSKKYSWKNCAMDTIESYSKILT